MDTKPEEKAAEEKQKPMHMHLYIPEYNPGQGPLNRDPYETNYYFCLVSLKFAPINMTFDFRNA